MHRGYFFKRFLYTTAMLTILLQPSHAFNFKHFMEHDVGDKVKHTVSQGADKMGSKFKAIENKVEELAKNLDKLEAMLKKLENGMEKIPHTVEEAMKSMELGLKKIEHDMEMIPNKIEDGIKSLSHVAEEGLEKAGFSPDLMKKTAGCFIPFLKQMGEVAKHPEPKKFVQTIEQSECFKDIHKFANTCNEPLLITAAMLPYVGQGVGTFCAKIDHVVSKFDETMTKLEHEAKAVEEAITDPSSDATDNDEESTDESTDDASTEDDEESGDEESGDDA
jgi:prefoldin subunit 5